MKRNTDYYNQAVELALKVDFLTNSEEISQYASAIYLAMMWGKKVDERNNLNLGMS